MNDPTISAQDTYKVVTKFLALDIRCKDYREASKTSASPFTKALYPSKIHANSPSLRPATFFGTADVPARSTLRKGDRLSREPYPEQRR